MFFTLVRIIKIGSASQLCHGQLYSDWSLSIIQVPDWWLFSPRSPLPWSWLTLLTQQWVHHRDHAPTFTRVLTLLSWPGMHLSFLSSELNTGYINNHLHPHSVLQSSGQPLHRGCHYLLAVPWCHASCRENASNSDPKLYNIQFKHKDTITMFTSLYAVKDEKMKTFTTRTVITLTHNPHPLTFEPSQQIVSWRKREVKRFNQCNKTDN